MNQIAEDTQKSETYITKSGSVVSKDDLVTAMSITMAEAKRACPGENGTSRDAIRKCAEEMADVLGITYQEYRALWAKYASDARRRKGPSVQLVGKKNGAEIEPHQLPRVVISDHDPFADDDTLSWLVKEFSKVKPGQVVTQTFDTAQHATKIRSLMSRISQKLGWKKYKTLLRNKVMYVKRIA